jgi:histidine triad (HIT) family protein
MDCLFCKIINGDIPSKKIFENDKVFAFKDINPKAPVHILVIHKEHTTNINDTTNDNSFIFADIFLAIKQIAKENNFIDDGYRTIINNGAGAGQEVFHTHVHVLSNKNGLGPLVI